MKDIVVSLSITFKVVCWPGGYIHSLAKQRIQKQELFAVFTADSHQAELNT